MMHQSPILKKLLFVFALLLIALASIGYFYYTRWQREVHKSAFIPYILENSALVCELKGVGRQWNNFKETTIGQDISSIPLFKDIETNLDWLHQSGIPTQIIEDLPLVFSMHGLSEEELGCIFYIDLAISGASVLVDFLEKLKNNNTYTFAARNYAGHTITVISQSTSKPHKKVYLLKENNYLMISFHELLIEDIIRGLAYKEPSAFLPLKKAAYKQGSLFINVPKLPSLLRVFLTQEYMTKLALQMASLIPPVQLDLKLTNHYLLLAGFIREFLPPSDKLYWIHALTQEVPRPSQLASYIPSDAAIVQCYTCKDVQMLANAMYKYRNKQSTHQPPHTNVASSGSSQGKLLNLLIHQEIGCCMMGEELKEQLLFINIKDLEKAISTLEEVGLISYAEPHQQIDQLSTIYTVHSGVFKDWLPHLLFPDFEPQFLTSIDDYIVLSTHLSALQQLGKAYIQGHTWSKKGSPQHTFLASMLASANFSMLVNGPYVCPFITHHLKPFWKAFFNKYLAHVFSSTYVGFQVANAAAKEQPDSYMNVLLAHIDGNKHKEAKPSLAAAAHQKDTLPIASYFQADAPLITPPMLVATHKKDQPYMLVQDTLYQLYFIDEVGNLCWKKQLSGPILPHIQLIDFYKNNKWQYMCATADSLHLIDYTGQEISNYPHRLLTTGKGVSINVIDYERNKNYRILITDAQGNIYLKDIQYRPLPGWNPKSLYGAFSMIPFHIRVDKDYFIALQENGRLYVLNRRGQPYPGFPINIGAPVHQPLIIRKGNHPSNTLLIVLTDEGKLNTYYLTGLLQKSVQLHKTGHTAKFTLAPDQVNQQDYVIFVQEADKVAIMDAQGHMLFEKEHETDQILISQYYNFGSVKLYVLTDPEKKATYIYDQLGRLLPHMPLANSGQPVKLLYDASTHQLTVYATLGSMVRKYQLTISKNE